MTDNSKLSIDEGCFIFAKKENLKTKKNTRLLNHVSISGMKYYSDNDIYNLRTNREVGIMYLESTWHPKLF